LLQFTKLKLSGFKSFVDNTEMPVEPGMTGVVGPNGCGKSNLVEALRWVMGETSAKQMRGKEMEDVIFGGTASRPSRNIATVALALDNRDRVAPAQFNEFSDLEVTRKIERDKGSTYRVNGKEVRARDVQLLFADAASGARSTALVSQGRVSQIISQKPTDRRHILEEAAGITGLHSRRHEAELRLRAAETNMERLDDILGTLETQLQGLKKQARQANRYRNLSDHIRKAEATLFHLKWVQADTAMNESRVVQQSAEDTVNELTRRTATASLEQTKAAADLPALREAEAAAAAELQRLTIARDGLSAEEARILREQEECGERLTQIAQDIEREQERSHDAVEAIKRLDAESTELEESRTGEDEAVAESAETLKLANTNVLELDEEHTHLTEELAAAEARRASLERAAGDLQSRLQQILQRMDVTQEQRSALLEESGEAQNLTASDTDVADAERGLEQAREAIDAAEAAREAASTEVEAARAAEAEARSKLTGFQAEEKALSTVLESEEPEMFPPLIDAVNVKSGYEGALGAALGDDLSAPADEPSAVHWRTLDGYDDAAALPAGAERLSGMVSGPKALTRRLSQVGVVADEDTGRKLQTDLKPGQRLVSSSGWLWRWDGFTVSPDAATGAAMRLEQRNRLAQVRTEIETATRDAERAGANTTEARTHVEEATEAQRAARGTSHEAEKRLAVARELQGALKEKAAARSSRVTALEEQIAALNNDQNEIAVREKEAQEAVASMPAMEDQRGRLEAVRQDLTDRRTHQAECQSQYAGHARIAEERERRIADIVRELESWQNRQKGAAGQIEQLEARLEALGAQQERLKSLPSEIETKRLELAGMVEGAEKKRQGMADQLAASENRVNDSAKVLREFESALADAREARARAEGIVEQNRVTIESIAERVSEKLQTTPQNLAELAEITEDTKLPDMESAERRVERLTKERDTMGPVNLRAEQEAEELTEQIDTLNSERDDLTEAIGKLRRGIAELNREGRQRLLEAFKEMDENFQKLFVQLFGGGTAHLHLTDADDPLEAGLEIMASPPGKKLQVLSLLSGGEQALTATALLFAAFLSNPAPICVLDEVDAPLDDANVDRFCSMVEKIAKGSGTRFILITHHRMTMARMDRLFGVTMTERGVSQLVSVDLQQAESIRDTATAGAGAA
jgi:chromosome segregation protein